MPSSTLAPLLQVARHPPVTLACSHRVRNAVDAMVRHRVGAVCVLENGRLAGIFTERDLMTKVVAHDLDPDRVLIKDVMARQPVSVRLETRRAEALELMLTNHFRHLPVVDDDNRVIGLISIRDLLGHQLERLRGQMDALTAYVTADGPGG